MNPPRTWTKIDAERGVAAPLEDGTPPEGLTGPFWRRAVSFVRRVVRKADEDRIFFMAGAISFDVIVAIVPLLLFLTGVAGFVVSSRFGDPAGVLIDFLVRNLPAFEGELGVIEGFRSVATELLAERTNFTILGAVLLAWLGGRLVASLRTVLFDIFDVGRDRGIIRGKLFDLQVVLIGGGLFLGNLALSGILQAGRDLGTGLIGLEGQALSLVQQLSVQGVAALAIWMLFLGIYRYLPARRIPWRAALIAATFTTVLHELLKFGFGWYVSDVANFGSAYGNLISIAVLFFWIYYEAIVFILGGEVAQVWTMRRARRVQLREVMGGTR